MEGPGVSGGKTGRETYINFSVTKGGEFTDVDDISDLLLLVGTGGNTIRVKPRRTSKGNYTADFTVDLPGFYPVDLHYQGKSVLKEPPRAQFTAPSSAKNTRACQVPTNSVPVGKESSFYIQSRNSNDLNNTSGGDLFEVSCDGPAEIKDLILRDSGDGKYTVCFTPPESGVYQFNITMNGEPIGNSPVKVSATRR
eukprot:TRINITY_DN4834_c0_g1_i1.p1 TRINITY_DN4834_c0_g1~~TRINITY_DN4834_c0_g1_i1.p1  ORF type:complete len:196 (+),score=62.64 TRINITY_DN4834_c0_g1_i1:491-1078(+)